MAYGMWVPQSGVTPAPPALEGRSLHTTTREAPGFSWNLTESVTWALFPFLEEESLPPLPKPVVSVVFVRFLLHNWHLFCDLANLSSLCWEVPLSMLIMVCVLVAQSCPTLCDPIDHSPPGPSVHGILQARVLEWVAVSFSNVNH